MRLKLMMRGGEERIEKLLIITPLQSHLTFHCLTFNAKESVE